VTGDAPTFQYDLQMLPRGRFTFRRWRYELWHGATLRACGWRTSPQAAERALQRSAAYWTHLLEGAGAAPAEVPTVPRGRFALGATVEIDFGAVGCVLAPRGLAD
jgi:hypothetical protein